MKVDVVENTFSGKALHSLNKIIITQPSILRHLENKGTVFASHGLTNGLLEALEVQPSILEEIKLA